MKKPVYVLEGGNEDDGPILKQGELHFFATAARPLHPLSMIYEFLKVPEETPLSHQDGNLILRNWKVNRETSRSVKLALKISKLRVPSEEPIYVIDDPVSLENAEKALVIRKELFGLASTMPIVFVPLNCINLLPPGSSILLPDQYDDTPLAVKVKSAHLAVVSMKDLKNRKYPVPGGLRKQSFH